MAYEKNRSGLSEYWCFLYVFWLHRRLSLPTLKSRLPCFRGSSPEAAATLSLS
jgi:hypothetical protein